MKKCTNCGYKPLDVLNSKGNTRMMICPECFTETAEFIKTRCKHKYNRRSNKKCIECGK